MRAQRGLSWPSIALLTTLPAACATVRSDCPPLVSYPAAFQARAAAGLGRAAPEVQQLVTDYSKMRDACRALKD